MVDQNKKVSTTIIESQPANDSKIQKQKTGGGFIVFLIILIAGLASSGGYYLWQQQQLMLADLNKTQINLESQIKQIDQASQSHILSLQDQHNLLDQQLQETRKLSQQAINNTNRSQRDWILAEIDYLLRIANRRLQISRDINGAIAALHAANQQLFELGDLNFFEIRKQLSDDIAKLKALHQVDINGTALTLDNMILNLEALPFKAVQDEVKTQLESTTTEKPEPEGFVDTVLDTVMNIGDIKIHQRSIQPASSADQQQKIEQLLRTYLLSSRLAVLRYDNNQFNHDIEQALQLLHLHYKAEDNRVSQMKQDLLELKNLNLTPDLPDINHSWKLLHELNSTPAQKTEPRSSTDTNTAEVL